MLVTISGRRVFALTLATWKLRAMPSRSTSATTAFFEAGLRVARLRALPPT